MGARGQRFTAPPVPPRLRAGSRSAGGPGTPGRATGDSIRARRNPLPGCGLTALKGARGHRALAAGPGGGTALAPKGLHAAGRAHPGRLPAPPTETDWNLARCRGVQRQEDATDSTVPARGCNGGPPVATR